MYPIGYIPCFIWEGVRMSWGGYIPGDMIRKMVEEEKLEEFLDTFYGRGHNEEVQQEEPTKGETQDAQR